MRRTKKQLIAVCIVLGILVCSVVISAIKMGFDILLYFAIVAVISSISMIKLREKYQ